MCHFKPHAFIIVPNEIPYGLKCFIISKCLEQ